MDWNGLTDKRAYLSTPADKSLDLIGLLSDERRHCFHQLCRLFQPSLATSTDTQHVRVETF